MSGCGSRRVHLFRPARDVLAPRHRDAQPCIGDMRPSGWDQSGDSFVTQVTITLVLGSNHFGYSLPCPTEACNFSPGRGSSLAFQGRCCRSRCGTPVAAVSPQNSKPLEKSQSRQRVCRSFDAADGGARDAGPPGRVGHRRLLSWGRLRYAAACQTARGYAGFPAGWDSGGLCGILSGFPRFRDAP